MKQGSSKYNRKDLGLIICKRLQEEKERMRLDFRKANQINTCFIDDVFPEEIAMEIYHAFPDPSQMKENHTIREYKKIAAQMDLYHPLLEEVIYAFQEADVVKACEEITGIDDMHPDESLYAGGISLMVKGNFLNPHLDNSHDNNRDKYRVLNLLYYVNPDWTLAHGGNLELWDKGMGQPQRTIVSKFNRLALMITNDSSIHSVSKVAVDASRCCVSNYYFSEKSVNNRKYFHVTSFYGRPEESFSKKLILKLDRNFRNLVRKFTGNRLVPTEHVYKKKKQ